MNATGKWIARAGALFVLVGFFLPSVSVSCSAMNIKQSFSLDDLAAKQNGAGGLFLVLIAALLMMALTFIPYKTHNTAILLIFGQLSCAGVSILIIIITLASLYNQVGKLSNMGGLLGGSNLYTSSLEYGAFVLLLGYVLAVMGALLQFDQSGSSRSVAHAGVILDPPRSDLPPFSNQAAFAGARLEVVSGNGVQSTNPVGDNFIVGRSLECQVQVHDQSVSRQHFRLRYAAGAWYLQDLGSAAGTVVNGQPVQAIRLNSGDQIKIGDTSLVFRL